MSDIAARLRRPHAVGWWVGTPRRLLSARSTMRHSSPPSSRSRRFGTRSSGARRSRQPSWLDARARGSASGVSHGAPGTRAPATCCSRSPARLQRETASLIEVGRMVAEADAAADLMRAQQVDPALASAVPEPVEPWFAELGRAVAGGTLTVEVADAIRAGLGEPRAVTPTRHSSPTRCPPSSPNAASLARRRRPPRRTAGPRPHRRRWRRRTSRAASARPVLAPLGQARRNGPR